MTADLPLPTFHGELTSVSPTDTPLLSMINGLPKPASKGE